MPWRTAIVFSLLLMLAASPGAAVQVGEEAPDFFVANINGDAPIILSDYRGEVVVLNFFWTG